MKESSLVVCVAALLLVAAGASKAGQSGEWLVQDDLFSLAFPTEMDGWACGRFGTILHTSDGGVTWERQVSGTALTLTSIHFEDPGNGWAVGNKGTILHTSNGGKSWERQESPVDYYLMCVYFQTPLKGFIATEQTHILGTDDGGRTWRVWFKDEDFILKSISFSDRLHGWVVGEFGYTYHTADGGESWQRQGGSYGLDEETGALVGETFLFDVIALDAMTAWAVGVQGAVKRTKDGGETWEDVDLSLPGVQLYCIGWDGKDTLVIGGRGICVVSQDRGGSWQQGRFEPTIAYSWIYGIEPLGPGQFAACGDKGALYFGARGGLWERRAN